MAQPLLKRTITKIGIAVLAINGLIGAGIFALPAGAAQLSGEFSPWMFVICALLMSFVIMSFAQLSAGFDKSGGPVLYTKKAFGGHVSFQTTWLLYVGRLTALAANTNALVLYLGFALPFVSDGIAKSFSIVAVIALLSSVNLLGVNRTMSILKSITVLKLLPLLAFIAVGLFYLQPSKLMVMPTMQLSEFEGALLLLVYAFIGFEGALVPAGESKNPTKSIGGALVQTLAFTTLLYFLIQSISVSVLPNLAQSDAPMAEAATVMTGDYGGLLITLAAVVSIAGNLATVIFTAPRMTSSLAEQGDFPAWFGQLTEKEQIPRNAIVFFVILAAILATTGTFLWLAIVSSLARLIGYFIAIAALVKIQPELKMANNWRLPFGLTIPVLALVICFWLASHADMQSWAATVIFMTVGSGFYLLTKRHSRQPLSKE